MKMKKRQRNSEQNSEGSVATEDDQGTEAGKQKPKPTIQQTIMDMTGEELTDQEIEQIRKEALSKYCSPYGKANPETYAYISALTKERTKVKELVAALEKIAFYKIEYSASSSYYDLKQIAQTALSNYQNKQQ